MNRDFREIAHCGGQITLTTKAGERGERLLSVGVRHSTPTPAAWFGVYLQMSSATIVGVVPFGGLADAPTGNTDGLLPVFVGADSEGRFGHRCPRCRGYWRSSGFFVGPMTCPYCAVRVPPHGFLSERQQAFIQRVYELATNALEAPEVGERVIDLDAAADATEGQGTAADFYAEKAMQTEFVCKECRTWNDVLGRFAYCSACGTRSEMQDMEAKVGAIRERINREQEWPDRVRDLVGLFDSASSQYVKEMLRRVALLAARRALLEGKTMHGLKKRRDDLQVVFGIDLFKGLDQKDIEFAVMMFERRHVYEHNGGEVDQAYLDKSGDTSVQLKQLIRETPENAMRLADVVLKLTRNLHAGFMEMFPPAPRAIEIEQDRRRIQSGR